MGVIILNKKKKKTLPPYGTVGTVPDPDLNRYGSTHAPPGNKLRYLVDCIVFPAVLTVEKKNKKQRTIL